MSETQQLKPAIKRWLSMPKGFDHVGRERELPEGGIQIEGERYVAACDGATLLLVKTTYKNRQGTLMSPDLAKMLLNALPATPETTVATTVTALKQWAGEYEPFLWPHEACSGKGCNECEGDGWEWSSWEGDGPQWRRARMCGQAVNQNRIAQVLRYLDDDGSPVLVGVTGRGISIEAPGKWRACVMGVEEDARTRNAPEWPEK